MANKGHVTNWDCKCAKCKYSSWMALSENGQQYWACVYVLKTGQRRPCEYGENCTVFDESSKQVLKY